MTTVDRMGDNLIVRKTLRRISDTATFEFRPDGRGRLVWNLPHGTKLVDMAHPKYPTDAIVIGERITDTRGGLGAYATITPDKYGFVVSTRGTNGNGGVRHRRFRTLVEAESNILGWADRRFRFPEEGTP